MGNDPISRSKESSDSLWCGLAIEKCQMATPGTPNPPRTRSQELGATIYTFKYFWKTNEYNGQLLLMLLRNTGKQKEELRDSISQLRHRVKYLETPLCVS